MEISIETIYRQVADGSLSKADALAMIRARNLQSGAAQNVAPGAPPTPSRTVERAASGAQEDRGAIAASSPPRAQDGPPPALLRPRRTLADPKTNEPGFHSTTRTLKRSLTPLAALPPVASAPSLQPSDAPELNACGSGIYRIRVNPGGQTVLTPESLAGIARCFAELKERSDAKVVLVSGGQRVFLGAEPVPAAAQAACAAALRDCELPVIAAMAGDALGLGWLLGSLCDFIVCGQSARYGFAEARSLESARQEWGPFLRERFGAELATTLLREAVPLMGAQLARYGVSIPIVPGSEVDSHAMALARDLARFPRESLSLLKRHLSRNLREESLLVSSPASEAGGNGHLETLPAFPADPQAGSPSTHTRDSSILQGEPVEVPFASDVVRLVAHPDGVLVATLDDRATKNAFSPGLTHGIQVLFEHIEAHPEYKVAILTGYDRYFASGGTKEGLLSIHQGTARYSDAPLYELPLRCAIPVIAAMQGHAIGAGWSFGMFCDQVVLAEDAIYSSRFIRYGFTPGFGSTLIFERRFGRDLGREILFAARDYAGRDLQRRGVPMPVVPAKDVLPLALEQAHRLALLARQTLIAAKGRATRRLLERLPGIVRAELAMHDRTFVGNTGALESIELHFDTHAAGPGNPANPAPVPPAFPSAENWDQLTNTLRETLAEELRMTPEEIDEDAPFTDLGLDSITGVSWVRRVNKRFGLSISANEVYHAPTLGEFARLVRDRLTPTGGGQPVGNSPANQQASPPLRPISQPVAQVREPAAPPVPVRHPLSEGQKGLWLLQRLDPDMAAYNVPVAFEIREARWGAALEDTLAALLARHPMLGAVIAADDLGQPYQYLPATPLVRLERAAIDALSDEAWLAHLKTAFKKPFRLDHDALLRAQVFTDPKGRQVVLITIHHILFDGTSLAIFLRDLLEIWSRAAGHTAPGAAGAAAPAFFDFVRWEQAFLQGAEGQKELAYWKEQLGGEVTVSEFPTDRMRPARRTYAGATVSARLSAPLSDRLRGLAKQSRVSLFTLLLAIYKVLLSRYTHQETLVVGVPVARRPDERFKHAIGYFVNMVAIKSAPGADVTFAAYLEQVKWTVLKALEHSHYPFARLVSDLRIEPSPTHSPVFQTVFVLQNFLPHDGILGPTLPGAGVELLPDLHQEGEYDLRFEMIDQGGSLEASVSYDADVLDPETLVRFIEHYGVLAEAIANDPEERLSRYDILPETERHQVEQAWNPPRKTGLNICCVQDVFEERAGQRPHAVALISERGQWTYREVRERVVTLAACLQSRGVRPEDRIALCLQRTPDLVVSVLAVLEAGAAYVPIDPAYPADRVAFLLADSGAKLILTDSPSGARLDEANRTAVPVIRIDREWARIQAEGARRVLARDVTPANLAYVIYTSGSTGKPKGVMVEHRQILNTLRYLEETYPLGESNTYLLKTSYTFDVSLAELFGWFFGSGRLAVLPAGDERLPDRIAHAIQTWGVTHVNFVPSALGVFLQAINNTVAPRLLASLKYVMVAGEAFPREMVAEAVRAFPGARVENIYGPTETAIYACGYACSAEGMRSANTPIGRPLANTRLYVLDRGRRSVGIGMPGELAIAGEGVARGYLNRPELTAAAFVDNPFEPGTRLFLTGDLVRWLPDGQIEYFGRIDQQVKVRGFRVEPGEIEGILNQHPGIQASAVVAVEQGALRQLVAYYVPKPGGAAVESQALVSHLGAMLPDYMVPPFFVPLATIPLTSSGKVDRQALSRREFRRDTQGVKTPPQGAIEDRIAAIWKDLLKLASVSTTDRFFEVGGNSLLAVMLAERVSREFKCAFPAAAVFKHATIQAIARQVAPAAAFGSAPPAPCCAQPSRDLPAMPQEDYPCYYDDSMAIIGMSCRFPGANDLDQFWRMLCEGRAGGRFLTPEELRARGVPEALILDPKFVPLSLAIEDRDVFDADFFNIPARNAFLMDPQFRQLLTHAWRTVEDAGYAPGKIPETSVFMSAGNSFYQRVLDRAGWVEPSDAYASWVLAQGGTIPAMISYALGFTGPSLFVHTNCSSSLAGLHLACQSLRAGESKYALVGGATLFCPSRDGYLHRPGLNFSSDGKCKTFDAGADGMVGGEGVAVILLKRTREALADGDPIYALVRGVAMNNDGPEKAGFYSPGVRGQAAVIDAVLHATRVDPESIGYLEAHGTGTHLGDPVEVMALTDAYRRQTTRAQFCGLGSVKSNIGHADTAAGLAGCIKLALSLHERTMVPSINYRTPNPAIDFTASPFYVADKLTPWAPSATPRRAALSSFGIGGSNVHAILEECAEPPRPRPGPELSGPFLVPLSARNPERLREMMTNLGRFLETHDEVAIADLAYTLSVGRTPMEARVAFLAEDRADLLRKLNRASSPDTRGDGFWMGSSPEKEDLLSLDDAQAMAAKWKREGRLDKLAQLWVRGFALDWSGFFEARQYRRVHLPSYPFAQDRYAVKSVEPDTQPAALSSRTAHPLPMENASTLRELAFLTVLSGREFFLSDHLVQGRKLLPAVVFLEMARAAAAKISENGAPDGVQLRDMVWLRPCPVDSEPRTLRTKLLPTAADRVEIEIRAEDAGNEPVVHCRGAALLSVAPPPPPLDIAQLRRNIADRHLTGAACYRTFAEAGFQYGAGFQAMTELSLGNGQALARLALPASLSETRATYTLHPSLMDGALQACAILSLEAGLTGHDGPSPAPARGLPFAVRAVDIFGPCPATAWAWIRPVATDRPDDRLRKFDIDVCDDQGCLCVQLRGYSTRAVEPPTSPIHALATLHYRQVWQPKPAVPAVPLPADAQRLVWTCGVTPLGLQTPVCRHLESPSGKDNLGDWFIDAAGWIFQDVKDALQRRTGENVLIQLVIPSQGPESCLGALIGLFRTAHLENPRFVGQIVEVAPGTNARDIVEQLALDGRCPGDVLVRHKDDERLVPLWIEADAHTLPPPTLWKDNGVYVITGGAGGLGRIFAHEILTHARNATVLLAGRSAVSASEIETWGLPPGRVSYHLVDLSRAEDVDAFIRHIQANHHTIDGILHAAGITRDNFILKKTLDEFKAVLAPKVLGTVHLERAARELNPAFIALFSSGVAWFGSPGQADYATANAFMDRFARLRREDANAVRMVSIDWPLWQEGGMRADEGKLLALQKAGLSPMPTAHGVAAFHAAVASREAQWMALEGNGDQLRAFMTAPAWSATSKPSQPGRVIDGPELAAQITDYVRGIISEITKRPVDKVAGDTPFEKYGIDSILQITIIEKLQEATGELAKTLLFEYSTLSELAGYLLREHADALRRHLGAGVGQTAPVPAPQPSPAPPTEQLASPPIRDSEGDAPRNGDIAIIGIGGRYPMAGSLEEFWDHLKAGRNCVTKVDARRWPAASIPSAPNNGSLANPPEWHGGFLKEIDRFDHVLFEIPPERVMNLSPETRLFLEVAWETFEDAGYARPALKRIQERSRQGVGVFAGVMYNQYPWTLPSADQAVLGSNATEWHIPNRVSHFFDLTGPSLAVNSACSSSLLAIHLACESLRQGTCSMALAGGVNLTLHPSKYEFLTAANLLDPGPASRAFGSGAGYIPGEGVGAVLLKPLAEALRDGDRIHGVIKASLASHAGGRQTYTAPDPQQQARLIAECVRRSGVDPATIGYVESAVNGSPLGDPIEVLALKKAFKPFTTREGYCALGSVKSNLGHLEAASGISQLSKVLLQMRHRTLVPSIHSRPRNPAVHLEGSPFFIPEECGPWPAFEDPATGAELPRRALINSIGAGGTCVCLLVEEHLAKPTISRPAAAGAGEQLLVLSAATKASLRASVQRLSTYLRQNRALELSKVARALFRREPLPGCRAALVATSLDEAAQKLDQLTSLGASDESLGIYLSSDRSADGGLPSMSLAGNPPHTLAAHWVAGGGLESTPDDQPVGPMFPAPPPYAFDHSRSFAFSGGESDAAVSSPEEAAPGKIVREVYLHDEPFLRDHTLGGKQILIGVTHASLAINAHFQRHPGDAAVHLQQLTFIKPIEVGPSEHAEVEVHEDSSSGPDAFRVRFRMSAAAEWQDTATGRLGHSDHQFGRQDLEALKAAGRPVTDLRGIYEAGEPHFQVGASFRTIRQLFVGDGVALAELDLTEAIKSQARTYHLHPLLTFSAFSALIPLLEPAGFRYAFLPFGIKHLEFRKGFDLEHAWVAVRLVKNTGEMVFFDADMLTPAGDEVARYRDASIKRLRLEAAPSPALAPRAPQPLAAEEDAARAVREYLLKTLGLPPGATDLDANLMELGLASAQLVELVGRMGSDTGISLDPTLFFEYPTLRELTGYFVENHRARFVKAPAPRPAAFPAGPVEVIASPVVRDSRPAEPSRDPRLAEGIAVIGMDGRFAGAANLEQFWQNLSEAKDLITEIPRDHWDYRPWYDEDPAAPDKTYCKWGSFLEAVDRFDPAFFNIPASEADWLDPQVRLLLQSVHAAAEHAGVVNRLRGTATGVFVGICSTDYQDRIAELRLPVDPRRTGVGGSDTAANRVSYWLDLTGPSLVFNTACSSSLFALHYACQALRHGECELAFVSGANLLLNSKHYRHFSAIRALSPSGRCRPFDAAADGYVPGECVGTVLLKPLARAIRDRDPIHAIIRGSAALHAGHAPSLTAPSVTGQENVLLKAWADAGIDPRTLSYIECHGTGTKLGDAVELAALKKALARFDPPLKSCGVGSVKANLGHTEGAAGIASLLKVILQMKHREIPGMPHFTAPNEYLRLDDSPLYIQAKSAPWEPKAGLLRAGVSAFGFSGSYAHVVVEEAPMASRDPGEPRSEPLRDRALEPAGLFDESASPGDPAFAGRPTGIPALVGPPATAGSPGVSPAFHGDRKVETETAAVSIVLSAKNEARLREVAQNLLAFVQTTPHVRLDDLAYTLQIGRLPMEERLAFVAESIEDLKEKLSAYAAAGAASQALLRERVGSDNHSLAELAAEDDMAATLEAWFQKGKHTRLLELWVRGGHIDWDKLHGNAKPNRIALPTYPFARERCWIPEAETADSPAGPGGSPTGTQKTDQDQEAAASGRLGDFAGIDARLTDALAPEAKAELVLRQSVARQLQCPRDAILATHTFLELPLGSLGLVELVQTVGSLLGTSLSPALLFEHPSIAAFAAYLAREHASELNRIRASRNPAPPPVSPGAKIPDNTCPLSEGQRGLWALQQTAPTMTAYNCPLCFKISEPLDIPCFHEACRFLLQQHPLLASRIEGRNGEPVFIPGPANEFELPQADGRGWSESQVLAWIKNAIKVPFDLDKDPLIRAALLTLSDRETVVVFTVHHIIFDGSSFALLMRSPLEAYHLLRMGRRPEVASGAVSYRDYVLAERARMEGDEGANRLAFWKEQLGGERLPLELPLDYPRSMSRPFAGQTVSTRLSPDLAGRLSAFGKEHALYASSLFLAVFQELLRLYSGQTDLTVGMPVNERADGRFSSLIGYFVNMIPVRSRGIGDRPFVEFAQAVQQTVLAALANRCPFPVLVRELKLSGQGDLPVFQAAFEYQNFLRSGDVDAVNRAVENAFPITWIEGLHQEGEYELALEVIEQAEAFQLNLKFNPTLLRAATATRMLAHLTMLLESAMACPQRVPSTDLLLTPAERHTLLEEWNHTRCDYPKDACIHHFFESQARRTPKAIAVVFGEETLSYQELDDRSTRLALQLQRLGVQPDALVGLCLERSLEMIVAILGVLKAGGAYLPLDPDYPDERLAFMVGDSKTAWILSQSGLAEKVAKIKSPATEVLFLDQNPPKAVRDAKRKLKLKREVQAGNLAYVLYTSGSTGTPKGVMVEHRALCNRILWMQRQYPLDATDRVLQKTPFSFDVSGWEFHWPLLAGARLIVAAPGKHKDPEYLGDLIQAQTVTVLHFVPSMLQAFLAVDAASQCTSLRQVFCSGEELTPGHVKRFFARFDGVSLHNLYGPTEAAIDVTYHPCEKGAPTVPIGKPIANVRLYVVDAQMRLLPIGFPGELCLAGDALARGYLNRPDLTSEKFLANPFEPGAKLYRTGDLARWTPDGEMEYLGRIDHQVKIRGCRIELGEIETAMTGLGGIREAVVVPRQDGDDKILAAFYVAPASSVSHPWLRQQLRAHLPEHMIPSAFFPLDRVPLTASGKVDRRALSQRSAPLTVQEGDGQPRTPTQIRLAALWRETLTLEAVGIHDSFFDLGGHSLSALSLMAKINAAFNVRLPLVTLFEAKCIADLARRLEAHAAKDAPTPNAHLAALEPRGSRPPLFLVPGIGGGSLGFLPLTRALGPDQPVFLFQPPGLEGEREPLSTIQDLAAFCLDRLPSQPGRAGYCLGGWSMGGVVAYEMACQLVGKGIPVARLILIDSYLAEHFEAFSRIAGTEVIPQPASGAPVPPGSSGLKNADTISARHVANVLAAHQRALTNYQPTQVYPGEVLYFYATENVRLAEPPDAHVPQWLPSRESDENQVQPIPARLIEETRTIWLKYVPRIAARFVLVPASHESILQEPAVNRVARDILAFCGEPAAIDALPASLRVKQGLGGNSVQEPP